MLMVLSRRQSLCVILALMVNFSATGDWVRADTNTQAGNSVPATPDATTRMELGTWRIEYNLTKGTADIFSGNTLLLSQVYAEVKMPDPVTSRDYRTHKTSQQPFSNELGTGVVYFVESANSPADRMVQRFFLYPGSNYFLTDVVIYKTAGATSNYIAPLVSQGPVNFPSGDNRALAVPFDNDQWLRYQAVPFGQKSTSHEVAAFYNNASRQGLVIGSVQHDTWKTGITSTSTAGALTGLEVFGGISEGTHDSIPHGAISGPAIKSPTMFVGSFSDWREGLDAYAKANAAIAPPQPWAKGVPFGWSSWGKLQGAINYDKAIEVSDFIATQLTPHHFENDNTAYICLDAFWANLSDEQLKKFVDHCRANNQEAGIYFTPFAGWSHDDDATVEGSDYKYKDIYLYANGKKQVLDGGTALDPTHPGTQKRIELLVNRFKEAGFHYIKADFMTHGAFEADKHYDPRVTTGIQAYSAGMKYISSLLGNDICLNLSIAPLFPAQYANSRRIACDTYGAIDQTEYELNSLTYGWWLGNVYDFNDPDHMVLDGFGEGENRVRVTSAAITGLFISGDDLSAGGSANGKTRVETYLTNDAINQVARIHKSFRPVEGNTGAGAADLFTYEDKTSLYLAAFNYTHQKKTFQVDFNRIGLKATGPVSVTELWHGVSSKAIDSMSFSLDGPDAALYKFDKNGAGEQ